MYKSKDRSWKVQLGENPVFKKKTIFLERFLVNGAFKVQSINKSYIIVFQTTMNLSLNSSINDWMFALFL